MSSSTPAGAAGTGAAPEPDGAGPAPTGPVAFTVELRVKPGLEAEFLDLLTPVLDAMRHEATFVNAVLHRDQRDPARFLIYETWTDLQDVSEVQLHRAYRKAYMDRLPAILASEREIGIWSPLRSDFAVQNGTEAPGSGTP